ncbi:hypothetical protein [Lactobacillus helveticus]|uniref:Uncharacterized protein n=1 Tax=Lactobacillus helveticus CIRM-BIA 104 TaxID=1226333 RepID=U6FFP1_LACHE|nr:hypothetical protein [Lactobacillus helveticus]CDI61396.1 Protein of unknown function [Lactobacillus helveticus CIRM-BIA 104]
MNRHYYKLIIENGQKTLEYIDKGITDDELSISSKLDNNISAAEQLMVIYK